MQQGHSKFFQVIKMVREVEADYEKQKTITNIQDAVSFAQPKVKDLAYEVMGVILLNNKHRPVGWSIFAQGTIDQCAVSPREVFTQALLSGAAAIILFHNHPSGDSHPSQADIEITKRIKEAGKLLGIRVLDHLVIGDVCYSMAENGLIGGN